MNESLTSARAFRQVDQLSGEVADWKSRYDAMVVSRDAARANERDLSMALQGITDERDELAAECAELRERLRQAFTDLATARTERDTYRAQVSL